jgi:hypothetical protein
MEELSKVDASCIFLETLNSEYEKMDFKEFRKRFSQM